MTFFGPAVSAFPPSRIANPAAPTPDGSRWPRSLAAPRSVPTSVLRSVLPALLAVTIGTPAAAQARSPADLDVLRDAWTAAYETGDVHALEDLYAEDAVRMPYDAPAEEGRRAILASFGDAFSRRQRDPEIQLTPIVVIVSDALAVERGAYDEFLGTVDGTTLRHERGKYVAVARYGPDRRWRYTLSIFNRDALPEPTQSPRP